MGNGIHARRPHLSVDQHDDFTSIARERGQSTPLGHPADQCPAIHNPVRADRGLLCSRGHGSARHASRRTPADHRHVVDGAGSTTRGDGCRANIVDGRVLVTVECERRAKPTPTTPAAADARQLDDLRQQPVAARGRSRDNGATWWSGVPAAAVGVCVGGVGRAPPAGPVQGRPVRCGPLRRLLPGECDDIVHQSIRRCR